VRPFDIHALLEGLAGKRPVFHSEADFQFALAWQIKEQEGLDVRLEFPPFPDERMRVDIWVPHIGTAIELKYLTRALRVESGGEPFALLDQGAQDLRRYDFLKDIGRLESVSDHFSQAEAGLAVLLTNDSSYWKRSRRETIDAAFRVHEGHRLPKEMCWSSRAGPGITAGRESPIVLSGSYRCRWRNYGPLLTTAQLRGVQFRYLAVSVRR
jgi:hypothetical protein